MKWTRIPIALAVVTIALCPACAGDGTSTPSALDGAVSRDARILDAFFPEDAAPGSDASPASDAGPSTDAGAALCTVAECDPREDECGADRCVLGGSGTTCTDPGTDLALAGEACDDLLDCAEGLACFRRLDGGVCARPCCPGDESSCDSDQRCGGLGVLIDGTATDWWHCVGQRECDPLMPGSACEPDEACYIVSSEGETDCRREGEGAVGDSCDDQNDCGSGLFCAGLTSPTCVRICSLGDAGVTATCPSGEGSCRAYSHSPPGTGLCTIESARAR